MVCWWIFYPSWNAAHWNSQIVAINVPSSDKSPDTLRSVSWPSCLTSVVLGWTIKKKAPEKTETTNWKNFERKARPDSAKDVVRLNIKFYAFRSLLRSHVSKFYNFSRLFGLCVCVLEGGWRVDAPCQEDNEWCLFYADDLLSSRNIYIWFAFFSVLLWRIIDLNDENGFVNREKSSCLKSFRFRDAFAWLWSDMQWKPSLCIRSFHIAQLHILSTVPWRCRMRFQQITPMPSARDDPPSAMKNIDSGKQFYDAKKEENIWLNKKAMKIHVCDFVVVPRLVLSSGFDFRWKSTGKNYICKR